MKKKHFKKFAALSNGLREEMRKKLQDDPPNTGDYDEYAEWCEGLLELIYDHFEEFLSKEATKWYARRPDYMTEEDVRKALCGKEES